jgi:nucleotide-binding universal stress UspA family protein
MSTLNGMPRRHSAPALEEHSADPVVEHIVLATDGGDAGTGAMKWLSRRAKMHRLDIDVVTVVEQDWLTVEHMGDTFMDAAQNAVDGVAEYLARAAPSAQVTTRVEWGDSREQFEEASEAEDLLVVGTNRTGRLSSMLGSSFPMKLAESAHCPVVVVPKNWTASHGAVVVGVQGDETDAAALAFATHEAEILHRELRIVHSWHLPAILPPRDSVIDHTDYAVPHDAVLKRIVGEVRAAHPGLDVQGVLVQGHPAEVLARQAAGEELLVVGSHGRTATDRFFIGSVSREMLTRPVCPVAVVRPRKP